jgi:hypothetical protein
VTSEIGVVSMTNRVMVSGGVEVGRCRAPGRRQSGGWIGSDDVK